MDVIFFVPPFVILEQWCYFIVGYPLCQERPTNFRDEYCTDISRVFPANGHFSKRQAQLYRVAYAANRAVMADVRPGAPFPILNRICRQASFKGLKALGLLADFTQVGKYVWHGAVLTM